MLAIAAFWAIHDGRIALGENERAWVGPVTAGFKNVSTLTLDTPQTITVEYHNTGRTPAVGTVFGLKYVLVSMADDKGGKIRQIATEYVNECRVLVPQGGWPTFFPTSGFSNYIESVKIPKDEIDWDVLYGVKYVVLMGCFAYETDNSPHHTAFCFFFQNGVTDTNAWAFCPMGNYAD